MNHRIVLSVLVVLLGIGSLGVAADSAYIQKTITPDQGRAACDAALEYATQGVKYKLGGQVTVEAFATNPTQDVGIDASGLVVNAYRSVLGDIRWAWGGGEEPLLLGDVSSSILFNWNTVPVSLDDILPGDLLFFKDSSGRITGVSIFVNRQGDMVQFVVPSQGKGKVVETFLDIRNNYWQTRFAGAGRMTYWQR